MTDDPSAPAAARDAYVQAVPGTLKWTEARLYELANRDDAMLRAAILVADHHKLEPAHRWAFVALVMRDRAAEVLGQNVELARMQPPPVYLMPPELSENYKLRAEVEALRAACEKAEPALREARSIASGKRLLDSLREDPDRDAENDERFRQMCEAHEAVRSALGGAAAKEEK